MADNAQSTEELRAEVASLRDEVANLQAQIPSEPQPLTIDDVKQMSREEINQRWDEVQEALHAPAEGAEAPVEGGEA